MRQHNTEQCVIILQGWDEFVNVWKEECVTSFIHCFVLEFFFNGIFHSVMS